MTLIKAERTKDRHSKWPWTNCDDRLDGWGYRLDFKEVIAQSKRAWITRPSNTLVDSEAELINLDLKNNVIDIVVMDSEGGANSPLQKRTVTRRKRKRNVDSDDSNLSRLNPSGSVRSPTPEEV